MSVDHLNFYRTHNISPVRQDIRDLMAHFSRRQGLYRQLGILPGFVREKKVVEVGPGSGFNALYTASLQPSSFLMIEPNPTCSKVRFQQAILKSCFPIQCNFG